MEQLRFLICTKKIKLNRWWKRDTFHDVVIASTFIAFRSSFSVLERDGQLYHFWYSCSSVRGNPPNVVFLTQIGMLDFELIELKLPWVFCFFLREISLLVIQGLDTIIDDSAWLVWMSFQLMEFPLFLRLLTCPQSTLRLFSVVAEFRLSGFRLLSSYHMVASIELIIFSMISAELFGLHTSSYCFPFVVILHLRHILNKVLRLPKQVFLRLFHFS